MKKKFEIATIKISIGDIVCFKRGMLTESLCTGKRYLTKKAEYLGDDKWLSIEKEEVKDD